MAVLGAGALLAFLAKRMYPGLPFKKLWLYYSMILAGVLALFFAIVYF
jgi:hypothetical protein